MDVVGLRGGGSEVGAEGDVAVEGFLGGDEAVGAEELVLDGLDAEAANPAAVEAVADAGDVGGSAVLGEAARRAFHALHI